MAAAAPIPTLRAVTAKVPRAVAAVAQAAWKGPRRCQVDGELATKEVWPTRGLAQGDSTAPKVLCNVLSPWETTGERFLFMDDRSLVCQSEQQLKQDTEQTDAFDLKIGAIENVAKRQVWRRGETKQIEHIGILATPDDVCAPIVPASGWSKLEKVLPRIKSLPGPRRTRIRAVQAYAKPLWSWGCPVFSLPPDHCANKVMQAVLRTRCTWWCRARFWALHIQIHPAFSTLLTAVERITTWTLQWSGFLQSNFEKFFEAVGLRFLQYDAERGIKFGVKQHEQDARVRAAFGRRKVLWSDDDYSMHALRIVCRVRALSLVSKGRLDTEGIEEVDIEASSRKPWKEYRKSLSKNDADLLDIFRCGAVSTPTRRHNCQPVEEVSCPMCGKAVFASMRHFVVECESFEHVRKRVQDKYNIKANWWQNLPRVTSKSGWITTKAAGNVERRSTLQVAVCNVGLAVLEATGPLLKT